MPAHMKEGKLDHIKLQKTIRTAMRMLDNVIDINYYAVDKAKNSNLRHRPVGLGVMGFQDCLHMMRVPYASMEAVQFADTSMEAVCYYAYLASTELAEERGRLRIVSGLACGTAASCPQDSVRLLAEERGGYLEVDASSALDWTPVRNRIKQFGMRQFELRGDRPDRHHLEHHRRLGLHRADLPEPVREVETCRASLPRSMPTWCATSRRATCWDEVMISDLKYFDGSLAKIDRHPARFAATSTPPPSKCRHPGWWKRFAPAEVDRPRPSR